MALSKIDVANMLTGATPVANGGTALTSGFKNGMTEADSWRLLNNEDISTASFLTDWERDDSSFSLVGTGLSHSSGAFSFPSTGIYQITANFQYASDGNDTQFSGGMIHITTDNSSYSEDASSYSIMYSGLTGSTEHSIASCSTIFDVTNTTTHKFKIQAECSHTCVLKGSSSVNVTFFTCIRLGDT